MTAGQFAVIHPPAELLYPAELQVQLKSSLDIISERGRKRKKGSTYNDIHPASNAAFVTHNNIQSVIIALKVEAAAEVVTVRELETASATIGNKRVDNMVGNNIVVGQMEFDPPF